MAIADEECICNRPQQWVICKLCNYAIVGRLSRRCPVHPDVMFMMDMRYCPCCGQTTNLLEVTQAVPRVPEFK